MRTGPKYRWVRGIRPGGIETVGPPFQLTRFQTKRWLSDRPSPCIPQGGPIAATTACSLIEFTTGAGTQSMDLIRIFGGIAVAIFVLYHWTNWRERCREYPTYLAHPRHRTPPLRQTAGISRVFGAGTTAVT